MIEENGFDALIEKVPWIGETWGKMILLARFILPFG